VGGAPNPNFLQFWAQAASTLEHEGPPPRLVHHQIASMCDVTLFSDEPSCWAMNGECCVAIGTVAEFCFG
jgi:hypothetical protein